MKSVNHEKKTGKQKAKQYRDGLVIQGGEKLKIYKEKKSERAKRAAEKERLARNGKNKKQKEKVAAKRASNAERTRLCRARQKERALPRVTYNEMVAIPPPNKEPEGMVLLRAMDEYMRENIAKIKEEFERYVEAQLNSSIAMAGVRRINGGRYEVFVDDAAGQGTGMFEWIMGEVEKKLTNVSTVIRKSRIEMMRKAIIVLANKSALKDARVSVDTVFQNHAMIVNLDACIQQDVHIDLDKKGHFQFGLICTDQVFGTKEYVPQEPVLGANCNVIDIWSDVPRQLARFLAKDEDSKRLLKGFGRLLSVKDDSSEEKSPALPLGTLLSLPGEVVHAGPGAEGLRAILFFTGTPYGETPYSSEIQHSRTTLLGEIIMLTWMDLQSKPDYAENRKYLLMKWNEIGLEKDNFALDNMHHSHLIAFANAIKNAKSPYEKETLMEVLAAEVWDETDWGDASFKYKMPRIASNKRKRPEPRKQRILPTIGKSNQEDRRVFKTPRKL